MVRIELAGNSLFGLEIFRFIIGKKLQLVQRPLRGAIAEKAFVRDKRSLRCRSYDIGRQCLCVAVRPDVRRGAWTLP